MRKLTSLLGVVAMTGAAFAAGVTSAGAAAPEAAPTSAVMSESCPLKGKVVKAKESVKIRKTYKLDSTALGLFPKGAKGKFAGCYLERGQQYTVCTRGSDNRWSYIDYRGTKGWIPSDCGPVI
ncbi:hypothetical protein AB0H77_07025 [Streptomyces sp. NPDC050844]|uniref:hypothetical protein n=1 Tax=Streptomyces sp. NPDC050844 TaxID=3155790 RepID=UPI0033C0AD76